MHGEGECEVSVTQLAHVPGHVNDTPLPALSAPPIPITSHSPSTALGLWYCLVYCLYCLCTATHAILAGLKEASTACMRSQPFFLPLSAGVVSCWLRRYTYVWVCLRYHACSHSCGHTCCLGACFTAVHAGPSHKMGDTLLACAGPASLARAWLEPS